MPAPLTLDSILAREAPARRGEGGSSWGAAEGPGEAAPPGRGTLAELVELGLLEDPDGFLRLALVRLELLFEWDPLLRSHLEGLEGLLEEVEELGWPASVPRVRGAARAVDLAEVHRDFVELSREDLLRGGRSPRRLAPSGPQRERRNPHA